MLGYRSSHIGFRVKRYHENGGVVSQFINAPKVEFSGGVALFLSESGELVEAHRDFVTIVPSNA